MISQKITNSLTKVLRQSNLKNSSQIVPITKSVTLIVTKKLQQIVKFNTTQKLSLVILLVCNEMK